MKIYCNCVRKISTVESGEKFENIFKRQNESTFVEYVSGRKASEPSQYHTTTLLNKQLYWNFPILLKNNHQIPDIKRWDLW